MKQYDDVIIGFGKGGKTLAPALAAAGRRVALLERSENMYGGTCINVGCIPSKSLAASARRSAFLGGDFAQKAARYQAAVEERERVVSMLRRKNYQKLADNPNIDVLTGNGRLTGPRQVEASLANGDTIRITASRIFINTGSSPRLPSIPGLAESRYVFTSETLMSHPALPPRLAIIGGGYIGMEFAAMYRNFGAEVTVVQDSAAFLPREDADVAQAVLQRLTAMGVDVRFEAKVERIQDSKGFAALAISAPSGPFTLEAEAVLAATGRIPNVAGLGLESAGVALTPHGAIKVDAQLRTTNPAIYAMGDVTGGLQFTYISLDDYRIVASAALRDGSRTVDNRGAVPYSVFLDPPFSRVGLTEKQALEQGYQIKVAVLPASAVPKAQVLGETQGILKAIVDAGTGMILGAHLFCAESHEIINIIKLAMDAQLPYTALRDGIFTHPTMAESFNDLFSSL